MAKTNPDRNFLKSIDARVSLHTKGTYMGREVTSRSSVEGEKLTESEMEKILSLMNGDDYVICPQNMNMGFMAGIVIATAESQASGMPLTSQSLLSFTDKQFPKGYTWGKVAKVYMGERNLELLSMIGIPEPKRSKSHYDY